MDLLDGCGLRFLPDQDTPSPSCLTDVEQGCEGEGQAISTNDFSCVDG
jgi:hypothetical protein